MNNRAELKKIAGMGGLLWMFSLITGIVISRIPLIANNLLASDLLDFLFLVLYAYLCISFYLQLPGGHTKDGAIAALGFILVFFLLDMIVTVPFFGISAKAYLSNWRTWTDYIVILIVGIFLGGSSILSER